MSDKTKVTVEEVNTYLDAIRPHIQNDGGDIEVVNVDENNEVIIKWVGACATCDKRELTFKYGVKSYLTEKMPEIKDIIQI
jgi:Fe-S cluster biogenesis protein NfuA